MCETDCWFVDNNDVSYLNTIPYSVIAGAMPQCIQYQHSVNGPYALPLSHPTLNMTAALILSRIHKPSRKEKANDAKMVPLFIISLRSSDQIWAAAKTPELSSIHHAGPGRWERDIENKVVREAMEEIKEGWETERKGDRLGSRLSSLEKAGFPTHI